VYNNFFIYIFLRTHLQVGLVNRFWTMMAQKMQTHARPFFVYIAPILWGKIHLNPILGSWLGVFQPKAPNIETFVLWIWNYWIDRNQILLSDHHQVLFVGGLNVPQTNPRWRMATILINHNISVTNWPILTKVGMMMRRSPPDPINQ